MKPLWEVESEALHHIRNGNAHIAMSMLKKLKSAGHARAHYVEGMMYRQGGHTVQRDMEHAISCFRAQCVDTPTATFPHLLLARVLLETGGEDHRREAWNVLTAVAEGENPPETALGFARYFATGDPPNFKAAAKWYRTAYFRGRPLAMGQLALLYLSRGHYLRMAGCSACMWLGLPIALIRFGREARQTF